MRGLILTFAVAVACASAASAQSGLSLSATTHPQSFDGASTAPCLPAAVICFDELVKSEPITLTITTTPTAVVPPPAILQPRRFSIWLGAEFAPGVPIGAFFPGLTSPELVYLSTGAATGGGFILPVPVIDSFFDPFGPVFGPPLAGPTNSYTATFGLDLAAAEFFLAASGSPLTLILQAIAEDTPGSLTPILLSNALELNLVDPEANHAPVAAALDAASAAGVHPDVQRVATPFAAETGQTRAAGIVTGGEVMTVDGQNFLAQTNWALRPPTITFRAQANPAVSAASTNVQILSPTRLAVTTPGLPALAPPATNAGYYDVFITNNAVVSPSGQPHQAAEPYLYRSGIVPTISGVAVTPVAPSFCLGPNQASPEGGDVLVISGTGLLVRSTVRLTHLTGGAPTAGLTPWRFCPADTAFQSGTQIVFALPPFCAGTVRVEVIAPDEEIAVSPLPVVYCDLQPALSGLAPVFTPTPLLPIPFPVFTDDGSVVTLAAENIVPPTSPLFAATAAFALPSSPPPATATPPACVGTSGPTAVPGSVVETRYELTGGNLLAPLILSPTYAGGILTALTSPSIDDEDDVRPLLGLKQLRAINPSCVRTGGGELPSAPTAVLLQDDQPPTVSGTSSNVLVSTISPGVCPNAQPVFYRFRIQGGNFFATDASKVGTFSTLSGPDLATAKSPAVLFTPIGAGIPLWSELVEVVSLTELFVATPPFLAPGDYVVTVMNPDGRFASLATNIHVVPPLTDPCVLSDPLVPILDAAALLTLADASVSRFVLAGLTENNFAIAPMLNPTQLSDHFEEQQNGSVPPEIASAGAAAYDLCFVFNTRRRGTGAMRAFDFLSIDVPRTITLPSPVLVVSFDGQLVSLPAGQRRVVFKAAAFNFDDVAAKFRWFYEDSYPLVLRSKGDLSSAALVDLGGDALFEELGLLSGAPNAYRARHDWTPAPAGGGQGGRGGSYYCSQPLGSTPGSNLGWSTSSAAAFSSGSAGCLGPITATGAPATAASNSEQWGLDIYTPPALASGTALPPIVAALPSGNTALGVSLTVLEGAPGYSPQARFDAVLPGQTLYGPPYGGKPPTGGRGGLGRAPTGGQGGGGAGGGFATAGNTGGIGATGVAAIAGATAGGASSFPGGSPIGGLPPTDAFIYGASLGAGGVSTPTTQADFLGTFGSGFAPPSLSGNTLGQFPVPLLTGGSGGGGGGGSVALFVPCVSIGGRGGNGGGSLVFVADGKTVFPDYGRVIVDGEEGRRGLDAFPIPNQDPLFVLCSPGNGGGGSGGLIYSLSIQDLDVATPSFVTATGGQPVVFGARGGKGGASPAAVTPTAVGGSGGAGRLRFAINHHSNRRAVVEIALNAAAAAGYFSVTTVGATPPLSVFPAPPSSGLSAFFAYPSP